MVKFLDQFHVLWKSACLSSNLIKLDKYVPDSICMFLLSEGSLTKSIDSITGEITQIKLINNQNIGICYSSKLEACLSGIMKPQIYRQIWLGNQSNCRLVFASSWWSQEMFYKYLPRQNVALGKMLIENELSMRREMHSIYYVSSKKLEQFFHFQGNIWSRSYTLFNKNKPFVLIQEFLSPGLINLIQCLDYHNVQY